MAGRGLMWLAEAALSRWPLCVTFVRGQPEREVFAAFGAAAEQAVPRRWSDLKTANGVHPVTAFVQVGRSGDWLFTREDGFPPAGFRPPVWCRLSARGAEAVAIYHDIGKLNHEFAHAFDGEVITAVTTSAPPRWYGSDPDRLRPLAEELCGPDYLDEPLGLPALLAIADGVFGLSLEPETLNLPWPTAPITQ